MVAVGRVLLAQVSWFKWEATLGAVCSLQYLLIKCAPGTVIKMFTQMQCSCTFGHKRNKMEHSCIASVHRVPKIVLEQAIFRIEISLKARAPCSVRHKSRPIEHNCSQCSRCWLPFNSPNSLSILSICVITCSFHFNAWYMRIELSGATHLSLNYSNESAEKERMNESASGREESSSNGRALA